MRLEDGDEALESSLGDSVARKTARAPVEHCSERATNCEEPNRSITCLTRRIS
jgi:hypothetical protein